VLRNYVDANGLDGNVNERTSNTRSLCRSCSLLVLREEEIRPSSENSFSFMKQKKKNYTIRTETIGMDARVKIAYINIYFIFVYIYIYNQGECV